MPKRISSSVGLLYFNKSNNGVSVGAREHSAASVWSCSCALDGRSNRGGFRFLLQTKWTCGRGSREDAGAITIRSDRTARVACHRVAGANAERWRRTDVRNADWSSTARTVSAMAFVRR